MRTYAISWTSLALLACLGSQYALPAEAEPPGRFVSVKDARFIDAEGRQILLHGLNAVDKSADWTQFPWQGRAEFAAMTGWGLNCIRLGFVWAGLEPAPGQYDEEYIAGIDKRIAWAKENGLYVFLDMHQDLYGMAYSDGAPGSATLTNGKPHIHHGGVWSDAYLTSPAVQTAFDNFWANAAGPDGVGIQERYALVWRHLAERYANEPAVIGYDLMNEPFMGSLMLAGQMAMVQKLAEVLATKEGDDAPTLLEIIAQWTNPSARGKLMARLKDMEIYVPAIDAAYDLCAEFEHTKLMPMFQRVTNAIREVDESHVIFLETGIASNAGVYSSIEPLLGPGGARDPLQAYAPHGYDIVVDTPDLASSSDARVELIFKRHGETAKRLDMPMVVGEWGAFPASRADVLGPGRFLVRQFEKLLCGDTFWLYVRDLPQAPFFEIVNRPFPPAMAGTLIEYRGDPDTHAFVCVWKEDPAVTAPSRVYLPESYFAGKDAVKLSPVGKGFEVEAVREGSRSVHLVIPPTGKGVERRLTVGAE